MTNSTTVNLKKGNYSRFQYREYESGRKWLFSKNFLMNSHTITFERFLSFKDSWEDSDLDAMNDSFAHTITIIFILWDLGIILKGLEMSASTSMNFVTKKVSRMSTRLKSRRSTITGSITSLSKSCKLKRPTFKSWVPGPTAATNESASLSDAHEQFYCSVRRSMFKETDF